MTYREDDYLQLSGIQHFAFCRRQWALAYIEQQWADNVRTVEGDLLHERAHDALLTEKRGDLLIVRSLPVYSRELGISGECDVVEFRRDDQNGVPLQGRTGSYTALPIEYKRGKPKQGDEDKLQLAAQAMCLSEMLCCEVPVGQFFYGEIRRRVNVEITDELRQRVRECVTEMHEHFRRRYTPRPRRAKHCNACSLHNLCLPQLGAKTDVGGYIDSFVSDGGGE